MREHVLRILKGSRRVGRCGRCRVEITWAVCAPRGRYVRLTAAPIVLREERNAREVTFEVVGGDQVHQCSVRTPRPTRSTPDRRRISAPSTGGEAERPYPAFTPERIQELKRRIEGHR
jgi:hypothetical protein